MFAERTIYIYIYIRGDHIRGKIVFKVDFAQNGGKDEKMRFRKEKYFWTIPSICARGGEILTFFEFFTFLHLRQELLIK